MVELLHHGVFEIDLNLVELIGPEQAHNSMLFL